MTGNLQPLDQKFAIVTSDGRPTLYFIKWAQQKQIDISGAITADQALQIIQQYLVDHTLQAGSGISLSPSGNLSDSPTIAAEVQAILDQISTTQGAVLFRGSADWQALAPGTSGDFLKTNGAGADPAWAAGGGGGTLWWFDPPLASSLTGATGTGVSPVLTDDADTGLIFDCGTPVTADKITWAYRTLTDKTLDWTLVIRGDYLLPSTANSGLGIFIQDSTTSRLHGWVMRQDNNMYFVDFVSLTGGVAATANTTLGTGTPAMNWFRIRHASSTYYADVSPDGKAWINLHSKGDTTYLTGRADRVGIGGWYNRAAGFANIMTVGNFSLTGPGV